MFNKIVFEGYINHVKSFLPLQPSIPEGFYFLPEIIFDPEMDYEYELKSWLNDNYQNLQLEEKPWIAIVWNRKVLDFDDDGLGLRHQKILNKNLSDPFHPTAIEYKTKQVLCPLDITYFSNSFDLLETLEEYFSVFLETEDAFDIVIPLLHPTDKTTVKIKNFQRTSITKENRTQHGEMCRLDTSLELGYLLSLQKAQIKLIGKGKAKIIFKLQTYS